MSEVINETSNKEILKRYGRNPKPLIPEPENPAPKTCPICQEKLYYIKVKGNYGKFYGCKCKTARNYHFSPPKK